MELNYKQLKGQIACNYIANLQNFTALTANVRIANLLLPVYIFHICCCCYFWTIVQTKYFPWGDIVKNLKMWLLDGLVNCFVVLCTYWSRQLQGISKNLGKSKLILITFFLEHPSDAFHPTTIFKMIFTIYARDCSRRSFIYSTCLVLFKIEYVLWCLPLLYIASFYDLH